MKPAFDGWPRARRGIRPGVIAEVQRALEQRADPAKKIWWENYVKGAAFRSTPMAEVREVVAAFVAGHPELAERELKALAYELIAQPLSEDSWRGCCCRRNVAAARRFAQTSVGWVLRELSKAEPDEVRAFLAAHGAAMSAEARRTASRRLWQARVTRDGLSRRSAMVPICCLVVLLVVAGCGGEDRDAAARTTLPADPGATAPPTAAATEPAPGTRIAVRPSRFGPILWGPKRQAIYIFERDARDRTRCYGACAKAWPPVYTNGRPQAGPGVRRSLLASIRRRDGRRQVTYAGKPLYFYAHEGPRQVLCHNVNLNGGLWWVVGADGERRP